MKKRCLAILLAITMAIGSGVNVSAEDEILIGEVSDEETVGVFSSSDIIDEGVDVNTVSETNDSTQNPEIIAETDSILEADQSTADIANNTFANKIDETNDSVEPELESEIEYIDEITVDSIEYSAEPEQIDTQNFSGEGKGTKEDPYRITTAQQMNEVRYDLSAYYVLENDIDLIGVDWEPIGDEENPFTGEFDGDNHIINNLTIRSDKYCVGLFGYSTNSIKNVNLNNVLVESYEKSARVGVKSGVGAIVGTGNIIYNCTVKGTINVTAEGSGGISVGGIRGNGIVYSDNYVNECTNYANINVSSTVTENRYDDHGLLIGIQVSCGGISGNNGKIENSKNYGTINAIADGIIDCGGICGSFSTVNNCTNYGSIYGESKRALGNHILGGFAHVGGVIGRTYTEISYSANFGDITGYAKTSSVSKVGGIAGYGNGDGNSNSGLITYCINAGKTIKSITQIKNADGTYSDDNNSEVAESKRIAVCDGTLKECYSLNTTTCNGNIPTTDIGPDKLNGGSLSMDEIEKMLGETEEDKSIGNEAILFTSPKINESDVDPKSYGTGYDITVVFDGDKVTAGDTGYIKLVNLNSKEQQTFDPHKIDLGENVLTIPNVQLDYGTKYSIQFDKECVYIDDDPFVGFLGENDWIFETKSRINIPTDTWNFTNPSSVIFPEKYQMFFPAPIVWKLRSEDNGTGGHCAGMVLTTIASYLKYPLISTYSEGAYHYLNEVNKYDKSSETSVRAIDFIDYAYAFQYTDAFMAEKVSRNNDYNGLYNTVSNFEKNGGTPVYIAIGTEEGGHALLGIGIAEEKDTYTTILVYDCNHPGDQCYLTLKGKYPDFYGWSYKLSDSMSWNNTMKESRIGYVTTMASNFIDVYKKRKTVYAESILATIPSDINAIIHYGDRISNISDISNLDDSDIIPICADSISNRKNKYYWLCGKSNTINFDSLSNNAEISITGNESEITTLTASGASLQIDFTNNIVEIDNQIGEKFMVNFSEYGGELDYNKISITGISEDKTNIQENNKEYIINGTSELYIQNSYEYEDDDGNMQTKIVGETSTQNLDPNHEYKIELENSNITVSEDTNGDGDYDKTIVTTDSQQQGNHTHAWNSGEITKLPTCTETGVKTYTCTICGETKEEEILAAGHNYGKYTVVKEATETEEGLEKRVCAACGEVEEKVIPKLPKPEDPEKRNGLINEKGVWKLYKDDKVDTGYTGLYEYGGGRFFIRRGILDTSVNGPQQPEAGGSFYFFANGQVQESYTGLAEYDGAWFVVEKGVFLLGYNDLYEYMGGRFYIAAGKWQSQVNGLHETSKMGFVYMREGMVQANVTDLVSYDGEIFYVIDGKLAVDYTGTVKDFKGAEFNVVNGMVR